MQWPWETTQSPSHAHWSIFPYTITDVKQGHEKSGAYVQFDKSWPWGPKTWNDTVVYYNMVESLSPDNIKFLYPLKRTLRAMYPHILPKLQEMQRTGQATQEELDVLIGVVMYRDITNFYWLVPQFPTEWYPESGTKDKPIRIISDPDEVD